MYVLYWLYVLLVHVSWQCCGCACAVVAVCNSGLFRMCFFWTFFLQHAFLCPAFRAYNSDPVCRRRLSTSCPTIRNGWDEMIIDLLAEENETIYKFPYGKATWLRLVCRASFSTDRRELRRDSNITWTAIRGYLLIQHLSQHWWKRIFLPPTLPRVQVTYSTPHLYYPTSNIFFLVIRPLFNTTWLVVWYIFWPFKSEICMGS